MFQDTVFRFVISQLLIRYLTETPVETFLVLFIQSANEAFRTDFYNPNLRLVSQRLVNYGLTTIHFEGVAKGV
jgi:hypothetical protein